jgi:hypothetical protein
MTPRLGWETFMRTRLLAAFLLLIAPISAQTLFFNGGRASLTGAQLWPISWSGRPGFLVISLDGFFLSMGDTLQPKVIPGVGPLTSFCLEAAYVADFRPCAVGAHVRINQTDSWVASDLGYIGVDGTLTNMAPVTPWGPPNYPVIFRLERRVGCPGCPQSYEINYCMAQGNCDPHCYQPYLPGRPQLAALVLTIQ